MKPTTEEVMKWVADIWGIDPAKPWHESALNHLEQLAALAYAAGAADMKERCAKVCEELTMGTNVALVGVGFAEAIRALGDNDD